VGRRVPVVVCWRDVRMDPVKAAANVKRYHVTFEEATSALRGTYCA
jgi:hypothetical protein